MFSLQAVGPVYVVLTRLGHIALQKTKLAHPLFDISLPFCLVHSSQQVQSEDTVNLCNDLLRDYCLWFWIPRLHLIGNIVYCSIQLGNLVRKLLYSSIQPSGKFTRTHSGVTLIVSARLAYCLCPAHAMSHGDRIRSLRKLFFH